MRILHEEIDLREETRAAEQSRPTLREDAYLERATGLAKAQDELAVRVGDVTERIRELPDGQAMFGKEIAILSRVEEVMREASHLLARPDTGPEPIAADHDLSDFRWSHRSGRSQRRDRRGISPRSHLAIPKQTL